MLNSNLYILFEYLLLIWLFKRWNHWKLLISLVFFISGITVWIIDNVLLHSIANNNSLFRLTYSIIIMLLSMVQICKILISSTGTLVKNAQYILCFAFVIYYSFKAYFESFNLFNIGISDRFYYWLWLILNIVNLFTNIIYTYAILWIKKNMPFALPY